MPTTEVIKKADQFLLHISMKYPKAVYIDDLYPEDQDNDPIVHEALEILEDKGLIVRINDSWKSTPAGNDCLNRGSYSGQIAREVKQRDEEIQMKILNYKKLTEDLKKVKSDNRLFKVLAIIGAVGTLLQIAILIFKD